MLFNCNFGARIIKLTTIEFTQSALEYLCIEELDLWEIRHFSLSIPGRIRHGIIGLKDTIDIRIPMFLTKGQCLKSN